MGTLRVHVQIGFSEGYGGYCRPINEFHFSCLYLLGNFSFAGQQIMHDDKTEIDAGGDPLAGGDITPTEVFTGSPLATVAGLVAVIAALVIVGVLMLRRKKPSPEHTENTGQGE